MYGFAINPFNSNSYFYIHRNINMKSKQKMANKQNTLKISQSTKMHVPSPIKS